jgi:MFS family permease
MTFPEEQEKYIALIETAVGVGLILGPVIGSSIYAFAGFSWTFFIIGSVFLILTPILYILIPDSINKNDDHVETHIERKIHEFEDSQPTRNNKIKVSFFKLLTTRRFLIASMGGMMSNFMYTYMEPVLAFRISQFNVSAFQIGMFFSIQPISYIILSFTISYFTGKYANRGIIMLGALFASFSMLFVGPSNHFPDELYLMGIGQLLIGGFGLFLMVPVIPEMISAGTEYYPNKIIELTDISAGVFNSCLGIGQVIGPIFGSYVTQATNFRTCSDIVGYILFTYSVVYFLLCNGLALLKTC